MDIKKIIESAPIIMKYACEKCDTHWICRFETEQVISKLQIDYNNFMQTIRYLEGKKYINNLGQHNNTEISFTIGSEGVDFVFSLINNN
jgi:hypothetical protein